MILARRKRPVHRARRERQQDKWSQRQPPRRTRPGADDRRRLPLSRLHEVYAPGTLFPDVRVPVRRIALTPTRGINGGPSEHNAPLRVYDTSGPYTDPR